MTSNKKTYQFLLQLLIM